MLRRLAAKDQLENVSASLILVAVGFSVAPMEECARLIRGGACRCAAGCRMLYTVVFATSVAGLLGAPWWGALAGGCVLALVLMAHDRDREFSKYSLLIANDVSRTISSLSLGALGSTIAFAVGRGTAIVAGI